MSSLVVTKQLLQSFRSRGAGASLLERIDVFTMRGKMCIVAAFIAAGVAAALVSIASLGLLLLLSTLLLLLMLLLLLLLAAVAVAVAVATLVLSTIGPTQ